jgi:hypothetical protein
MHKPKHKGCREHLPKSDPEPQEPPPTTSPDPINPPPRTTVVTAGQTPSSK